MIEAIIFDGVGTLYERNIGLFHYSKKVLSDLKERYKLGLITIARSGLEKRRLEIEKSGVSQYFSSIIIDTMKSPEHYLNCMQQLKTIPETTVIVDDRVIHGIRIGNMLGCETYWIQDGEHSNEVPNEATGEPTQRIETVEDLLIIL